MKTKNPHNTLDQLHREIDRLDDSEREELTDFLDVLVQFLRLPPRSRDFRTKRIKSLRRPLARTVLSLSSEVRHDASESLRDIRNRLAHNSHVDQHQLDGAVETLWTLLKLRAADWDPNELSRLIGYALRDSEPVSISRAASAAAQTRQVVSRYELRYKRLPSTVRPFAARELILRLLSERPGLTRRPKSELK